MGDYFYVNPGQNSAQSEPAVAIVAWLPLGEQSVVGYDEAENSFELAGLAAVCPDSGAALSFSCHVSGVEAPFGFLSLDLWHGDGTPAQAWVTATISAEGRFSVAHSAARLDDLCATDTAGVP